MGDLLTWLELADVCLVDPVSKREGVGSLTVENGIIASLEWAGGDVSGKDVLSVVVAPGFVELAVGTGTGADVAGAAGHGGFVAMLVTTPALRDMDHAEVNAGVPATILGLRGSDAANEVAAVRAALDGAIRAIHIGGISTAAVLEPIRDARARGVRVTCDVAAHHLALHDGWLGGDRRFAWDAVDAPWIGGPVDAIPYDSALRVEPPLRSPADAVALLAALGDGTIDAIAPDHRVITSVAKDVPFGEAMAGIAGIETTLGLVLEMVDAGRISLPRAMATLTWGRPSLRVGTQANLVVFDRAERWEVSASSLVTQSRSPLDGRSLPGRVLLTVADGHVAWVAASD